MYHMDWLMSQIRLLAAAIARAVFHKDAIVYEADTVTQHHADDALFKQLLALIDEGKLNEAEDLLFEALQPDHKNLLLLAVDFYQRLNQMSDEALERCQFSRQEIYDGLRDAQHVYGLYL